MIGQEVAGGGAVAARNVFVDAGAGEEVVGGGALLFLHRVEAVVCVPRTGSPPSGLSTFLLHGLLCARPKR